MTDINSLNTQELVYNINHQKAEIARYVKQKCNTEQNNQSKNAILQFVHIKPV